MRRKHKYVIYGLNDKLSEVVVLKTSEDQDYETFLQEFPNDDCRWGVYDLEYDAEGGGKRNKVVLISWCVHACPVLSERASEHLYDAT